MRLNILPDIEELRKYFYYDETSTTCLRWTLNLKGGVKKGDCCGNRNSKQYFVVKLKGIKYSIHRIIWKLHTGNNPKDLIDHIDGNPRNNKISNLREATPRQNVLNIKIPKSNTSGAIGVYWMSKKNKWKVEIKHSDGKLKYHGLYSSFEEAKQLAESLRLKEHGEWIRKI